MRVYMLEHRGISPSNLSRYCAGTFPGGDDGRPVGDENRILSDLAVAGEALGEDAVLIPATDEWTVFMAKHDSVLRQRFRFPSLAPDLATALSSKEGLYRIASANGLPTPRPIVPRTVAEALCLANDLHYPVMVKPDISRPSVDTKLLANDPAGLARCVRTMAESEEEPNVVLQEYIPGNEDWTFTGYFDVRSRCLAGFTGRRLRTQPPHMGHTSLGTCVRNAELQELAVSFMSAIGYRGIVDAEFRYDRRDGTYKVLDANPRVGGNFRVFVDTAGTDVIRALYLDMTNQEVPRGEPEEGRLWIKEDSDLISFVQLRRAGELGFRNWVRSLRGVREGATLSLRDPVPFMSAMLLLFTDTVGGRLRREA